MRNKQPCLSGIPKWSLPKSVCATANPYPIRRSIKSFCATILYSISTKLVLLLETPEICFPRFCLSGCDIISSRFKKQNIFPEPSGLYKFPGLPIQYGELRYRSFLPFPPYTSHLAPPGTCSNAREYQLPSMGISNEAAIRIVTVLVELSLIFLFL